MAETLNLNVTLLFKIGGAILHAEQMLLPGRHDIDRQALALILTDPEVRAWLNELGMMTLPPIEQRG